MWRIDDEDGALRGRWSADCKYEGREVFDEEALICLGRRLSKAGSLVFRDKLAAGLECSNLLRSSWAMVKLAGLMGETRESVGGTA